MAVYVDDSFETGLVCKNTARVSRMTADTDGELEDMARWFNLAEKLRGHLDGVGSFYPVSASRRQKAILLDAVEKEASLILGKGTQLRQRLWGV